MNEQFGIAAFRSRQQVMQFERALRRAGVPASIVTTPRTCVQYVVTEYGVADLRYKSVSERARALISIAHPDFRAELARAAGV